MIGNGVIGLVLAEIFILTGPGVSVVGWKLPPTQVFVLIRPIMELVCVAENSLPIISVWQEKPLNMALIVDTV